MINRLGNNYFLKKKKAATRDWTGGLWLKLLVLYHLSYGHQVTASPHNSQYHYKYMYIHVHLQVHVHVHIAEVRDTDCRVAGGSFAKIIIDLRLASKDVLPHVANSSCLYTMYMYCTYSVRHLYANLIQIYCLLHVVCFCFFLSFFFTSLASMRYSMHMYNIYDYIYKFITVIILY